MPRKGWEQFNLAGLGLQQHFCDSAGAGCVAIDGEDVLFGSRDTSARISKQIIIGRFRNETYKILMRVIALQQAGIVHDQICPAPLALFPVRRAHTALDSYFGGSDERRRGSRRNLVFGIESDEMRSMAMIRHGILEVFEPLLQLAVTANLEGRQFRACALEPLAHFRINGERLGRLDAHRI